MFEFRGEKYEYFDHPGNQTRVNERRMELPIAFRFIEKHYPSIIEIGNVSRHYRQEWKHDVIDLYEKPAWPIWNEDILSWKPPKKYEAAISISTVEHTADPLFAIKNIQSLAKHSLITCPMGYSRTKEVFKAGGDHYFMVRKNENNEWAETFEDISNYKYAEPYPYANAVIIIIK